jgi:hypothetical protein
MPMKAVYTPAKLMHGKIEVLARFYNPGSLKEDGEADPLHPPYLRISRELMGRVIHTMRHEYISDDENLRMSSEFKGHVKVVFAPLEATLAKAATRLSEHPESSMEQHEKLIKDAHDHLTEASEHFKAALKQQVHVMLKHNDSQEVMVERTENLAIQARKKFRDLSHSSIPNPDRVKNTDAIVLRDKLRETNAQIKSSEKVWNKNRDDFMKRIQQLEDKNKKLMDQISHGCRD